MSSRIGVTATNAVKARPYIDALQMLGATAVWLANDAAQAEKDVSVLDGILVSGGPDIAPEYFGEVMHAMTEADVPDRDAYELDVIKAAWRDDVPLLAICRGVQAMNVALGGSLIQHVPDVVSAGVDHYSGHDISERHVVELEGDSQLARLVGERRFPTNSSHHQALARVAESLRVTARTSDGIIEAVEPVASRRFWIGVQWHPERTIVKGDAPSRAIFQAFVEAASA